jgi:hypothetical protein
MASSTSSSVVTSNSSLIDSRSTRCSSSWRCTGIGAGGSGASGTAALRLLQRLRGADGAGEQVLLGLRALLFGGRASRRCLGFARARSVRCALDGCLQVGERLELSA